MAERGSANQALQWILTATTGIAGLGGTIWLTHVDSELGKLRAEQERKMEVVATVATTVEHQQQRLDRMEHKLDRILENTSRHGR